MAKSDYICEICKKVKGSNWAGNATERYKCATHGFICRDCVSISGLFTTRRECRKCGGEVLLYDFNSKRGRWEKH